MYYTHRILLLLLQAFFFFFLGIKTGLIRVKAGPLTQIFPSKGCKLKTACHTVRGAHRVIYQVT